MELNSIKDINEALDVIANFKKSPLGYINELNTLKKIDSQPVVKNRSYIDEVIKGINEEAKKCIDVLCSNLDFKNNTLVKKLPLHIESDEVDYSFDLVPIKRVGIYIPYKLPSSALTYLSMATAADVNEIVVYLAQDDKGCLDPLSVYVCSRYGVEVWGGPARTGFPALAFGLGYNHPKVDLICGPCGNRLNLIKSISALVSQSSIDMNAGASDLCIVSNTSTDWQQIYLDMLSQLEHGIDSKAQIVLVGLDCHSTFRESPIYIPLTSNEKITIVYCNSLKEAAIIVDEIAPESLELIMNSYHEFISMIRNYGVLYINTSSTLGDYAVIGRGCSDPTNGLSKAQSGISPYTFLNVRPIVHPSWLDQISLVSARYLSNYEGLICHENVIAHHLEKRIRTG